MTGHRPLAPLRERYARGSGSTPSRCWPTGTRRRGHPGDATGAAAGARRSAVMARGRRRSCVRCRPALPRPAERSPVVSGTTRCSPTAPGTSARSPGGPGPRNGKRSAELPSVLVEVDGAQVRAVLPGPGGRARQAARQVAGRRHRCPGGRPGSDRMPGPGTLRLWIPPEPTMTLGKTMAQAGHAGMIAAALLAAADPAVLARWAAAGAPAVAHRAGGPLWDSLVEGLADPARAWDERSARRPGRRFHRDRPRHRHRGGQGAGVAGRPAGRAEGQSTIHHAVSGGIHSRPWRIRLSCAPVSTSRAAGDRAGLVGRVGPPVRGTRCTGPTWVPIGCRRTTGRMPGPCSGRICASTAGVQMRVARRGPWPPWRCRERSAPVPIPGHAAPHRPRPSPASAGGPTGCRSRDRVRRPSPGR